MYSWTSPHPAPTPPRLAAAGDDAPAYYVPIPLRLTEDLRNAPVAIGAFALLARAFRATRQAVPLSAGDLQVFDPSLSDGAAARAIQRLVGTGWLIPQRRPGRKTIYTPAWGVVSGTACPWDLAAACLGRPRHILALRLDQRLLDVCMGRLAPHPAHPARAERYLAAPLLGLREIGAYALALAGLPVASPRLEDLHLLVSGRPLPVPAEATILAVASQRTAHALTAAGWRRTPFGVTPEAAPAATDIGQALFFVPPGQIGHLIGTGIADQITDGAATEERPAAAGRPEPPAASAAPGSHGIMNQNEDHTTTSTSASTPPAQDACGGGGDSASHRRTCGRRVPDQVAVMPLSESTRLLQAVGVRRSVAVSLEQRPVAQVARVIDQARARPGVRDLAAWVVSALRDLPEIEEPLVPERRLSALPIHIHPGLSDEQRDRWIYRFRAVTTPREQRAILEQLEREHPVANVKIGGSAGILPAEASAGKIPALPFSSGVVREAHDGLMCDA